MSWIWPLLVKESGWDLFIKFAIFFGKKRKKKFSISINSDISTIEPKFHNTHPTYFTMWLILAIGLYLLPLNSGSGPEIIKIGTGHE